jgi:hypothetical protein
MEVVFRKKLDIRSTEKGSLTICLEGKRKELAFYSSTDKKNPH